MSKRLRLALIVFTLAMLALIAALLGHPFVAALILAFALYAVLYVRGAVGGSSAPSAPKPLPEPPSTAVPAPTTPRIVRREPPKPRLQYVTVAFHVPGRGDPLRNFVPREGYTYIWPFKEPPRVGDWAIGEGFDGPSRVVVGYIGRPPDSTYTGPYKTLISRL